MNTRLLLDELQTVTNFSEKNFPAFLAQFEPFKLKKGDCFYRAGEIPKYIPFILKGCMRKYFINEAGEEQIVYFAEEQWFAGEIQFMRTKTPTDMYLQALEDCEILGITIENAEKSFATFPEHRRYFDIKYPLHHNRIIKEATRLKSDTPESLYLRLLKNRPSLILRVPQHHLANYLGIRTETISRIRNKLAKQNLLI